MSSPKGSVHGTRAVVIGGGGTGAATLHELTSRGFHCTLVERGELTSGTTGRHHGQLHSGARYAVEDREIARECMEETRILRAIAPESIESNCGLFLALTDSDADYAPLLESSCRDAGIPVRRLSRDQALTYEPRISPSTRFAVLVPDGTIDAYRLPLQFLATAVRNGGVVRSFCEVRAIEHHGGEIDSVVVWDHRRRREERLPCQVVVNAGGPWAGEVASLAGIDLPVAPAPGTMVAVKGRACNMVVSHLHPPGDGDIVVPQRQLSIIGSTQWETDHPYGVVTPEEDIRWLLHRADQLVSGFSEQKFHAAWTAVRPLIGRQRQRGRRLSRDFAVVTHQSDGVSGFYSVVGGKATVLRAMGQAVGDRVCEDRGLAVPSETAVTPLLSHRDYFRLAAALAGGSGRA